MTEDQIMHMVNRFLGWELPNNFNPDAGVSYAPAKYTPTGTSLFDANQATEMVRYMIEGMPGASLPQPSNG